MRSFVSPLFLKQKKTKFDHENNTYVTLDIFRRSTRTETIRWKASRILLAYRTQWQQRFKNQAHANTVFLSFLPWMICIFGWSFLWSLDLHEEKERMTFGNQRRSIDRSLPNSSRTKISPFCVVHLRIFCNSINSFANMCDDFRRFLSFLSPPTFSFAKTKPMPSRQTCNNPPSPVFKSLIGNSPPNSWSNQWLSSSISSFESIERSYRVTSLAYAMLLVPSPLWWKNTNHDTKISSVSQQSRFPFDPTRFV